MKQNYWTYNKPLSVTGLGGGATSLLNVGDVASLPTYNDVAYDNFFTKDPQDAPINISNSSYDTYSGVISKTGIFYDHSAQKIWYGYDTPGYYDWTYGGGTYPGSAGFYGYSSGPTTLTGGAYIDGISSTIAYLGDDTPVIVVATQSSSTYTRRLYFYNYPSGTLIDYLNTSTGTNQPIGYKFTGLCFNGSQLLVATDDSSDTYVYAYDLPANTSAINNTSTISTSARWSVSHGCFFGLAWGGGGRIYLADKGNSQQVTQFILAGGGYSGTSTTVTTYSLGANIFNVVIDYKNRKLIIGGFNTGMRVFGE